MEPQPAVTNEPTLPKQPHVLLLGDDGRMRQLLHQRLGGWRVESQTNVPAGIIQLGQDSYDAVFINAEKLGKRTVQAVKALREVDGGTRLVLFGEAYAEVYAQEALKTGADDFLVWPIPSAEIIWQVQGRTGAVVAIPQPGPSSGRLGRTEADVDPPTTTATGPRIAPEKPLELEQLRQLAQSIPEGLEKVIEQAEKILPGLLQVEWIKICPITRTDEPVDTPAASHQVELTGPTGSAGEMLLGERTGEAPGISPQEAGQFLGTVLYLAQREAALRQLAIIDDLTGAHNRRYLEHFLREIIRQYQTDQTELTLLLFDIDEFKYFNDTYGHLAGDEVLRETVKLISRCCRKHDVVARLGGDEFAVVFWDSGEKREVFPKELSAESAEQEDTTAEQEQRSDDPAKHPEIAVFLSNRILRMMRTKEFPRLGPDARGVLTISGGLARFPNDGTTVEELLASADEALLSAKRSGKNRIYLVGQPRES